MMFALPFLQVQKMEMVKKNEKKIRKKLTQKIDIKKGETIRFRFFFVVVIYDPLFSFLVSVCFPFQR